MPATPSFGMILLGLVVGAAGVGFLLFADRLQRLALTYQPPGWYEQTWRGFIAPVIRSGLYVLSIRLVGAAFVVLGAIAVVDGLTSGW